MEQEIREKLLCCGQEKMLSYIEMQDAQTRSMFADQIRKMDLSVMSESRISEKRGIFSPLSATGISEIETHRDRFLEVGRQAVAAGKVGAVMLAGGQGSRLGFEHPKGMFNIGISRELYIFECQINNLLDVVRECGAWVPLFIMTSEDNYAETTAFFKEHAFFGYEEAYVWFFKQEQLPVVDTNGNLMLAERSRILTAPNGNGGWYQSMASTGMTDMVREKGIEWLNVFSVDNVLQRIADPCFVGAVIESGCTSGAKVVAKADPEEKVGVLCLEDGRPSIAEYFEMTEEMRTRREPDGKLSYNYGVILNYLFRVDKLETTLSVQLPLHRAFKPVRYMQENGAIISPEKPNAYKFETLALDMVKLQDSCLSYEVDRSTEFAPVKNRTGVDSVDSAREMLQKNGVIL